MEVVLPYCFIIPCQTLLTFTHLIGLIIPRMSDKLCINFATQKKKMLTNYHFLIFNFSYSYFLLGKLVWNKLMNTYYYWDSKLTPFRRLVLSNT